MGFKFQDKSVVEAVGKWDLEDLTRAWEGLDRFLNEINVQYRNHTQSKGSPFELDYHKGVSSLYRSGQVLITNAGDSISTREAFKEEDYRGRIEVRVAVSEEALRVEIEDNGMGVHSEIEPYLFTSLLSAPIPVYLLKGSVKNEHRIPGRLGDDLRQVRKNMEGQGGRVFYQNKGHNLGAIFGYEVPLSSLRVPLVQAAQ